MAVSNVLSFWAGTFCCKLFLNIGSAWGQSCILCFPMASELHSAFLQWRIERVATGSKLHSALLRWRIEHVATGCVGNGTCQEWVAGCKLQCISTTTEERCKEISLSKLMPSTSLARCRFCCQRNMPSLSHFWARKVTFCISVLETWTCSNWWRIELVENELLIASLNTSAPQQKKNASKTISLSKLMPSKSFWIS